MNKDYQKPEVEFVNLTAMETTMTDGEPEEIIGGGTGVTSAPDW